MGAPGAAAPHAADGSLRVLRTPAETTGLLTLGTGSAL